MPELLDLRLALGALGVGPLSTGIMLVARRPNSATCSRLAALGSPATPLLRDFFISETETMRVCAPPSSSGVASVSASAGPSSTGLKLKTTGPIEMESPSFNASLPLMVLPLTRVPLDEPRSSIKNEVSSMTMRACFRETPAS